MSEFLQVSRTRKVSLRFILVVPFVLQIFAAVGLTGWISLRNGQKAVNELADQLRIEASDRIAAHLDHYLAVPKQINQVNLNAIELGLLDLSDLKTTGQFFLRQMQTFNVGYIDYASRYGEFIGIERLDDGKLLVNETLRSNLDINAVYSTDPQGNRVRLEQVEPLPAPVQSEDWYADAANVGHPVWSKIYQWSDKPEVLSISSSYPIYSKSRQLVGVIGVDLILTQISTFLKSLPISDSSQAFILERDGALVASSGSERPYHVINNKAQRLLAIESQDPVVQAATQTLIDRFGSLQQIRNSQPLSFELKGERRFVRVTPWQDDLGLNWLIVVVVPESDFMEAIDANTHLTVLLCLGALAIATLVGLLTSRLLIKPILRVISAAEALSEGHWQHHISESGSYEQALLARAFNRMAGQLQESFAQLEYSANHDRLTGLLNQTAFKLKLKAAIAQRKFNQDRMEQTLEQPAELFAVLFLDLDYFKVVNDSLGHLAGDQLLIAAAERLNTCLRSSDAIARFGGDEFVILLSPLDTVSDVIQIADRLLQSIQAAFRIDGNEMFISTSIGIALSDARSDATRSDARSDASDESSEPAAALLRNADIALYRAKAKGKDGYEIFDAAMHTEAVRRLQLETDLRRAIDRNELTVFYQPIVDIHTRKIAGFEALMRWHHPTLGRVSPADFIPIAEESGLIVKLGWWALRQACQQMKSWQQEFGDHPSEAMNGAVNAMIISVNLSCRQFFQADLIEQIERILAETGLAPQNLKLEITESLFLSHTEATRFKLRRLRSYGIQLSIDDFGTGYSSLSYLHRFPINTLKIDRSFISRLGVNGENVEIVEAITVLAHKLGMDVVAEGVETAEQLEKLRAIGCEQAQGFLFSPPVPAEKVTELFHTEHHTEQSQQAL
jgi:diguanylate cyclase (GGDEF)-like protein